MTQYDVNTSAGKSIPAAPNESSAPVIQSAASALPLLHGQAHQQHQLLLGRARKIPQFLRFEPPWLVFRDTMERDQHSGIGWLLYLYVCQPASAELNLFEYTHLQGGWLKISPLPDDRRQGLEKRIATFQIDLAMKLGVGEIHTDEITEDQGVIAASAPTDHAIPICIESQ